jgi:hypothetical protein
MADDNTDNHQSADDALEPADDIYRPDKDEEQLEGDFDTPAAPPSDVTGKPVPPDDPDTGMDQHEVYDEGEADAAHDNREEENPTDRPQRL